MKKSQLNERKWNAQCAVIVGTPPLAPPKTRPTRVKTDQNLKFFGDFEQNEYHGVSGLIPTNQEVKITESFLGFLC